MNIMKIVAGFFIFLISICLGIVLGLELYPRMSPKSAPAAVPAPAATNPSKIWGEKNGQVQPLRSGAKAQGFVANPPEGEVRVLEIKGNMTVLVVPPKIAESFGGNRILVIEDYSLESNIGWGGWVAGADGMRISVSVDPERKTFRIQRDNGERESLKIADYPLKRIE